MITANTKFQLVPFIISLSITLSIGVVASFVTRPEIEGWYSTLIKPSFNPPAWIFAPVWVLIYILIAIAAYLVWKRRDGSPAYQSAVFVYMVQLLLNFSWSVVFFGLHQVFAALIVILLLLAMILININSFSIFTRAAAWLMVPYLLWVSFATLLNLSIYILNK